MNPKESILERIEAYLKRKRLQLEGEFRHRLAYNHLDRVTFTIRKDSEAFLIVQE